MTEQSLSKQLGQSNQEGGERDKKKRLKKYDGTFYPFLSRRLRPLRWEMNCVCYLLDSAF